jgi:hypothetical protein
MNQSRLQNLREDASRQQQQAQQVANAQQQTRLQAQSLTGELRSSNAQLDTMQQNIRLLEAEQANPELTLPGSTPPAAATTPATPAATP